LHCATANPNLLAVTDEDGGIMLVNTGTSGPQSIVQGEIAVRD